MNQSAGTRSPKPPAGRQVTREDILPDAVYALERKARRSALLPMKRRRRVALGPYCTLYFENFATMLFQIQEMLITEKGGEDQIADELAAYNPLIPGGRELVATVMFEIDDARRRDAFLSGLGGVERRFFLETGDLRSSGTPEGGGSRTREDGKTSSVHFLRFPLSEAQIAALRDPAASVIVGCDHPRYAHLAVLSAETRAELEQDLG
jgi:hypothetical protein